MLATIGWCFILFIVKLVMHLLIEFPSICAFSHMMLEWREQNQYISKYSALLYEPVNSSCKILLIVFLNYLLVLSIWTFHCEMVVYGLYFYLNLHLSVLKIEKKMFLWCAYGCSKSDVMLSCIRSPFSYLCIGDNLQKSRNTSWLQVMPVS